MFVYKISVICALLTVSEICLGRQQNYRTNTDFLAHEIGSTDSKRDYVAPKRPDTHSNTQTNQQQFTSEHQSSTLRATTTSFTQSNLGNKPQQPSGKRDYVAPLVTQKPQSTFLPHHSNAGKVQDLINFYDNKNNNNNNNNNNQNVHSYSAVLQGNNNRGGTISNLATTKPPLNPSVQNNPSNSTPKPLSFSAVVAGPNKQPSPAVIPTRPSTKSPSNSQSQTTRPAQTTRPGTPVLPSSLLNQNRKNNNNNNNNNQNNANGPTDAELQTLSEELLRKDTNNAAKYVTINYQEKTTSQSKVDNAALPLLTVAPEVWNISTIQKFTPLLDNYVRDTLVNEYVTAMERTEENNFMDAVMSTSVIRHLMNFLANKGYVTPDPRQQKEYLKQMWFGLYSRGKGKLSSSGFEHVFVSELRNSEVLGLHNWIYFAKEESANRVNYLGYLKYTQLGDKGAVLKLHFNQEGADKPVDTMFIGTSPELEIALYTLCFVTRAGNDCNLKLETKDVDIVTHTFRYRSKNYIGSAYPQI
ncbi:poly(U)-specific endoribonuclease homolog [Hyposmocoma kahamanoa]|uniref:poly(U)-specific endoribonuclease homolog n=1 Tax=Hyposmocoma kahamanoa TaxID=1477025 RepID=UPI000E6D6777|nr:poly(U)-specific endoribonuclease homolog [Hyposmocoma kahamanoa]